MTSAFMNRRQRQQDLAAMRRRQAETAVQRAVDLDRPPTARQHAFIVDLVAADMDRTGAIVGPQLEPISKATAAQVIDRLKAAAKAARRPRFDTFGNRKT